ncbi:MAG TPA: glycosyl hydrolase family 28-related protein [Roseiflexaceae bacterium]|nr:glycosyl hydrolase family 28-related protein [Roseiflexaceae bacterium]
MDIQEVLVTHTPNSGRLIWNANDHELERRLSAIAVNVRVAPYQAAGDGIADDRPAIQSAIDDCASRGGGTIFLPAGTYLLQTGALTLKDKVSLIGAGMYSTTIKLGDMVGQPVITDERAGVPGSYAFGRVYLANFGIDGNRTKNPSAKAGLFLTAYYSVFEQLYIRECQSDGMCFGFNTMANQSSQNRIVGCRVASCGGSGICFDINGIDSVVSENYVHNCDIGILIKNGGVRIVNNCIFGHTSAAVQVKQTSYGSIISNNDINGNKRHGVYITRTTTDNQRGWGQMLVATNSILGDNLEADNLYDGIYVDTSVESGIAQLSIIGNKIFALNSPNRFRYGVNLARNITESKCGANHVQNTASAPYNVGLTCSAIEIDRLGTGSLEAPALPDSDVALVNPFHAPVTVYLADGDVSNVALDGRATGLSNGCFRLAAGQAITLTYNAAPTWSWFAD